MLIYRVGMFFNTFWVFQGIHHFSQEGHQYDCRSGLFLESALGVGRLYRHTGQTHHLHGVQS